MVLGRKQRQPIKVQWCEVPGDITISDVESLTRLYELADKNQLFLETDTEYFLLDQKGHVCFRYVKPDSKPRIIHATTLEMNPDRFTGKVELSEAELFQFAKKESLFLFETQDSFVIPSDVMFWAKKKA
jgi:hypothetical protein